MDAALKTDRDRGHHALLWTGLAPVIPQLLGSIFNIWYNAIVIDPLLGAGALRARFFLTILVYNSFAYPIAIGIWLWQVFSLRSVLNRLRSGLLPNKETLIRARRRAIHLPWYGASISGAAWLLGIPVFLLSLAAVPGPLPAGLIRHLPISFSISAFIALTNSFFLAELVTQWLMFPLLFQDARADLTPGVITLSLRGRGLLWAISACACPIVSLLLLEFAPGSHATDVRWFSAFVGGIGIASGLGTALLVSQLVVRPVDQLRAAAQAVARGSFDLQLPVTRADEFGFLIGEFNHMTRELKEKERLRQTFGLHVGRQAAEQILARDPGLGGVEQEITVMFVDIRSFTARAATSTPRETLESLNAFLTIAARVVEEEHGGMINKYLGDGFMAFFGTGAAATSRHAQAALNAGRGILRALSALNREFAAQARPPLQIGIGLHSGLTIVGSIGSPQRLEFTAIGSTVNLASRIESLTKQLDMPLLLTAETHARLLDTANLVEQPPQKVRGVDEPVKVFAFSRQERIPTAWLH